MYLLGDGITQVCLLEENAQWNIKAKHKLVDHTSLEYKLIEVGQEILNVRKVLEAHFYAHRL